MVLLETAALSQGGAQRGTTNSDNEALEQLRVDAPNGQPVASTELRIEPHDNHEQQSKRNDLMQEHHNTGISFRSALAPFVSKNDTFAQWIMALFGILALFVSVWAVFLLKMTLKSTRDAVEEAKNGTQAANASVSIAQKIGEAQVRAYMGLKNGGVLDGFDLEYGKTPSGYIVFTNYGSTPAYNVSSAGFLMTGIYMDKREYLLADKQIEKFVRPSALGVIVPPGGAKNSMLLDNEQYIDNDEIKLFEDGTRVWYFFGCLFYDDIFQNECRTYYGISVKRIGVSELLIEHIPNYNYCKD